MSSDAAAAIKPARKGWQQVLANLRQPKVLVMLLLGFSSGIPLYLVGNTLGFWMRENGIELSTIGFLSWVGLAYSLKFLWAPLVDKLDAPVLGRWLGRRRGWMLLSQIVVAAALTGMALVQPQQGQLVLAGFVLDQLLVFGVLALVVAFASATQDIVIDAWRIEIADSNEQQGLLTSTSALGYRGALLVTDALILIFAAHVGWSMSYELMAALMGVGMVAVMAAREPAASALAAATPHPALFTARGLFDALIGPFVVFFRDHGRWALLMLLTISLYRLPDFVFGPMANPFYADLGIEKETVGAVRGSFGLVATIVGIAAAGLCALRFGFIATLLAGAVLGPALESLFRLPRPPRRRPGRVHRGDGDRQLLQRLRRRGPDRLHVQPDQRRLHRHPVRPAELVLCLAGQGPEGPVRGRGRTPGGGAQFARRVFAILHRYGPDRRAGPAAMPDPGRAPTRCSA